MSEERHGRPECGAEAYYGGLPSVHTEKPGGVYVSCVLDPGHPPEERHLTVVNGQSLAWGGERLDPVGPVDPS